MIKGNVPIFDETIDPTDPTGSAKAFAGMSLGVVVALAAYGVGTRAYNELADRTPADNVEVF